MVWFNSLTLTNFILIFDVNFPGHTPSPIPIKCFFEYKLEPLLMDEPGIGSEGMGPGAPRQVNVTKPSAAEMRKREGRVFKRPAASEAGMKRPSAKRPAAAIEDVAAAAEPVEEVQPAPHPAGVPIAPAPAVPPIESGDQPLRYGCSKCKNRQKGCTQCRRWASEGKHHREVINGDVVDHTPR